MQRASGSPWRPTTPGPGGLIALMIAGFAGIAAFAPQVSGLPPTVGRANALRASGRDSEILARVISQCSISLG